MNQPFKLRSVLLFGFFVADIYQIHYLLIAQRIIHDHDDPMFVLLLIWMIDSFPLVQICILLEIEIQIFHLLF